MKAAGANVWLDQLDIEPGMRWDREVEDALTNCPRMLVVLSPALRMTDTVLDLLSLLVKACYEKNKTATLQAASAKVNLLGYLLRLSKDLKHFPEEGYFHVMTKLDEIGRMLGGWVRERSTPA